MRSAMRVGAALALIMLVVGCVHTPAGAAAVPSPVILEVHNLAFADVDILVVTSPGSASAVRLTTVTGLSNASLPIPGRCVWKHEPHVALSGAQFR